MVEQIARDPQIVSSVGAATKPSRKVELFKTATVGTPAERRAAIEELVRDHQLTEAQVANAIFEAVFVFGFLHLEDEIAAIRADQDRILTLLGDSGGNKSIKCKSRLWTRIRRFILQS
jgi:hypothetical protein